MANPFEGSWLKWYWAVSHAQAFEADIKRFAEDPHNRPQIRVRADYHSRRHAFAIVVEDIGPPLPPRWGLRLGDVASNYRAALDHLAWTLVTRGSRPPSALSESQRRSVGFPIARDNATFNAMHPKRLPGARRADVAVVRRYQPYSRGPTKASFHYLTILAELNNFDKHRELQPVLLLPRKVSYNLRTFQDSVKKRKIKPQSRPFALVVGREIGTIPVRKTGPNPSLDVEVQLDALVGLENHVALITWFDNARVWMNKLLREFEPPPVPVFRAISGSP